MTAFVKRSGRSWLCCCRRCDFNQRWATNLEAQYGAVLHDRRHEEDE